MRCQCGGSWWSPDPDGLLCCGLCGRSSLPATLERCKTAFIHRYRAPCPVCCALQGIPLPLARQPLPGDARAPWGSLQRGLHANALPEGVWSRKWERCVECGQTDSPHKAGGWCHRCYSRRMAAKVRERSAVRP